MPSELRSGAGETLEFEVGPVERDDPAKTILSSSGAVITTVGNHGYVVEDVVRIDGHLWNPINGTWVVSVINSPTQFTLGGAPVASAGGETGTVTRLAPVDLTITGTTITFAAREDFNTVNNFVEKAAVLNFPSSARKNLATVTILPADTDVLELSTDFYFDVWMEEFGGRRTRLDRGIWKVGAAVAA